MALDPRSILARVGRSIFISARSWRAQARSYLRPALIREARQLTQGAPLAGTYAIATKRGLFVLEDRVLTRVLHGDFYGVTRLGDVMFVFENCRRSGRILGLHITSDLRVDDAWIVRRGLSPGCHQIDYVDGRLLVADTYNNRILAMDLQTGRTDAYYPLGSLADGRRSPNYAHMNSIYKHDDRFHVICHNESAKTGKPSELLVLTPDFEVVDRIELPSRSAHNIAAYRGTLYHCDSLGNGLRAGDRLIFVGDHFTRGLSISDDYIIVGGSEYARREERSKVPGYVYVLRDGSLLTSFRVPGMVQEIRRLDAPDYGLSMCSSGGC
jgi:hypothetical protein